MIFGKIQVTDDAVITHRDSYLLNSLTVVSVRRPVLVPALMSGCSSLAFSVGFSDLLFLSEMVGIGFFAAAAAVLGVQLGQLKLVSRDLKNTELSSAIWGRFYDLQSIRHTIVEGVRGVKNHKLALHAGDEEVSS